MEPVDGPRFERVRRSAERPRESIGGDAHVSARAYRPEQVRADASWMKVRVPAALAALAIALGGAGNALAAPARTFGVYVDPWHVTDWTQQVGAAPDLLARFEAFSRGETLDGFLRESEHQGYTKVMVSWEPWKPVPVALGDAQSLPQRGYRNRDILHGAQDPYIRRFARSLATFHGVVYLRYAHEMNGTWYPWSLEPRMYVLAWRRLVRLVRSVGASNVRFVWSPNPNLYEGKRPWLEHLRLYWPGVRYVDDVGSTMINFGGRRRRRYTIARFAPRFEILHRQFRKPLMLTETNTEYAGRVDWLRGLRRMLRRMSWIRSVEWSQLKSRGGAHLKGSGDLSWTVETDPAAAAVVRAIIRDLERPASR
jgi:mannan endo-1,4-beta-mannosidase